MAKEMFLTYVVIGKITVINPQKTYPNRIKGFRLPHLERVRSLSVPIRIVVRVATMALAATIQATGRGSGEIVSKTKLLNQVFSTAQAI